MPFSTIHTESDRRIYYFLRFRLTYLLLLFGELMEIINFNGRITINDIII